ncbi:MAG: hypothetical protein RIC95_08760 [Vicingaceae bacterium]
MVRKVALYLILIGFTFPFFSRFIGVSGIGFISYLSSLLLFVGASYLSFYNRKRKWLIFFITIGIVLAQSIIQGMFHSLLLVSVFMLMVTFSKNDSFIKKALIIIFGFFMSTVIQSIKHDYRSVIWENRNANNFKTFTNLLIQETFLNESSNELSYISEKSKADKENSGLNARLNQGWIISKVMDNVPANKEFAGGETIYQAIEASVLPRILFPNKAGGEVALKNFKELTGLKIGENTSMGLSLAAEFYANFGIRGGWFAMFVYGLLIGFLLKWIVGSFGNYSGLIILWIAFFFFQVVKAETDFIKMVNHLFKSLVYFYLLNRILLSFGVNLLPRSYAKDNVKT